jgi:CubicO group peptidase (beta-lactamase class C family)
MSPVEIQSTASDLGLMTGQPIPAERFVTHANQLLAPFNRWSFQNELKLNHTADVWRGSEPASGFSSTALDISRVTYQNRAGTTFSFEDMVEMSYTDAIIVLHQGKIVYERYLNGMQPHSLHAWASGSKSVTGTLAALLEQEGLFDPEKTVGSYLPELVNSGFGDASIRQVMDMTTAVNFPENDPDPVSESRQYAIAAGWREAPLDYSGPNATWDFLPLMRKEGEHGQRFCYATPNTDVLAWLITRLSGKSLSELMSEKIWTQLGSDRDAFWIVDPAGRETAGSGLVTTARDMARFGQLLLQKGWFNDRQILPMAVVADIEGGGDRSAFARGPAASPANQGYSYHCQWWNTHNAHAAYQGMGYGGQILYIDPVAQMVIAKFSSYPTPTPAGNEFYSAMAAFPALGRALAD